MDVFTDGLEVIVANFFDFGDVAVAGEFAVLIVVARRERHNAMAQADEVFRLAGKHNVAAFAVPVVERADADGVTRSDEAIGLGIVNNQGELGVELLEHLGALFFVERE